MLRPRIIPCLLVHEGGLVKTLGFKDPKYVGDPINAVKIFNEKEADELIILDIDATAAAAEPDYKLIADVAAECRMPLCYGGGIRTPEQAKKIIRLGVEKVAISSAAVTDPGLLTRIAEEIGRQSVVVVLDVRRKRGLFKSGYEVYTNNGTSLVKTEFEALVKQLEAAGAGEIVVNSIDCDGKMQGYDLELGRLLRRLVSIPISILGGAGSLEDIKSLISECGIVGAVAGSLFVFKGQYRAVLINYPNTTQKDAICSAV